MTCSALIIFFAATERGLNMKISKTDKLLLILKTLWRIPAALIFMSPLLFLVCGIVYENLSLLILVPVVPFLFRGLMSPIGKFPAHFNQEAIERYDLPSWLLWASTPDEKLPAGMYEPQAAWVYKYFGTVICSMYWVLIRNVGSGIMWKRAIPLGAIYDKDIDHNDVNVLKAVAEQVKIDNNLLPVKWGIFKLHWELTKDFYGVLHDFKSEGWKKCGYIAKLEIGVW